jgi:hypothetical protein
MEDKKHFSHVIAIMGLLNTTNKERRTYHLSLMAVSFLPEYWRDVNFATNSSFRSDRLDETSWNEHILKATKQVRFYCRGLVELSTGAECSEFLRFTHRSIPEFLHKDIFRQKMALHLEGFQVDEAVSQLCLAEIRSQRL